MNKTEFQGMCQLVEDGKLVWVERGNGEFKGRVISCSLGKIKVDVGEKTENWGPDDCKELTYGYKVDYEKLKQHPNDYDSHAD